MEWKRKTLLLVLPTSNFVITSLFSDYEKKFNWLLFSFADWQEFRVALTNINPGYHDDHENEHFRWNQEIRRKWKKNLLALDLGRQLAPSLRGQELCLSSRPRKSVNRASWLSIFYIISNFNIFTSSCKPKSSSSRAYSRERFTIAPFYSSSGTRSITTGLRGCLLGLIFHGLRRIFLFWHLLEHLLDDFLSFDDPFLCNIATPEK